MNGGFGTVFIKAISSKNEVSSSKNFNTFIGELYLNAKSGVKLPLGVWGRLEKK